MSRLRFKFLLRHLCLDDKATRQECCVHDRFAAMRDMFEACNETFAKCLVHKDLSIDETLYPMRNQVAFKQYNPSKPSKYCILFKPLNSARYPYTYQTHFYCGKPESEPTEHYVCRVINYIKYLVEKTEAEHSLGGRNISMDRLYTSFPLCDWILNKGITIIGTHGKQAWYS